MRFASSQTVGIDDAFENPLTQTLAWGYEARPPPLYTWLLWAAQRVGGYGLGPFPVIKYALLAVIALSVHTVACRATTDAPLAALAAFSMSALYQNGWNVHEGVTHTVVLSAAIPLAALIAGLIALAPALATAPLAPWARGCRAMTLAAAAVLVVAAAAGVLTWIKEHHLHALFLMSPVWFWAEIGRRSPRPPVRVAGTALLSTAAVVVAVRLPGLLAPEPSLRPGRCRHMRR